MKSIDEQILYLQSLKAAGHAEVAVRVITYDDLEWNAHARSLMEELFGHNVSTMDDVPADVMADYQELLKEMWCKLSPIVEENFCEYSDDAVMTAIDNCWYEWMEDELYDKTTAVGELVYKARVNKLMRENDWDADTAKSMLAIS